MMMEGGPHGGSMAEDMGIFRTRVGIESHTARGTVRYKAFVAAGPMPV